MGFFLFTFSLLFVQELTLFPDAPLLHIQYSEVDIVRIFKDLLNEFKEA